ncbi:sigma-E factor negative regulatory protein [Thiohalocapsa marina]|nr:sigma-E factor negative regulatory protein [Thiohalocapsa marina]
MHDDPRPTDLQQTLSALLDGECPARALGPELDRVLGDPDARARWERYHLIGRLMRSEAVDLDARDIAARVRERIGSDLVPMRRRTRLPSRTWSPARIRQVVPLASALAASVAVLAVVIGSSGMPGFDPGFEPGGPGPLVAAEPGEPTWTQPQLQPGSSAEGAALATAEPRWQQSDPLVRAKLDSLLLDHQERLSQTGMPGFVSYTAVVGYESGR